MGEGYAQDLRLEETCEDSLTRGLFKRQLYQVRHFHSIDVNDTTLRSVDVPGLYFLPVYQDYQHSRKESALKNERDSTARALLHTRQAVSGQIQGPSVAPSGSVAETVKKLQRLEEEKYEAQMKKIAYYEQALETFLDIKCSWVKKKQQRLAVQDEMVKKLDTPPCGVVSHLELKEIFENDAVFCGNDRKTNGKLRHLYVQNWKLQVERDKYRNIVESLRRDKSASGE